MHRILRATLVGSAILCSAGRCAPIRTTIENATGRTAKVLVSSPDGRMIARGDLPAGRGLDLEEPLDSVGTVRYEYDGHNCAITQNDSSRKKSHRKTPESIELKPC
jgi:hypothetical protein